MSVDLTQGPVAKQLMRQGAPFALGLAIAAAASAREGDTDRFSGLALIATGLNDVEALPVLPSGMRYTHDLDRTPSVGSFSCLQLFPARTHLSPSSPTHLSPIS